MLSFARPVTCFLTLCSGAALAVMLGGVKELLTADELSSWNRLRQRIKGIAWAHHQGAVAALSPCVFARSHSVLGSYFRAAGSVPADAIPVLIVDLDVPGFPGDRPPPGALRFRVVGVEPLGLGIDDDVAGPGRFRVKEIDPVRRDHELPAEQKPGPRTKDEAPMSRWVIVPFL